MPGPDRQKFQPVDWPTALTLTLEQLDGENWGEPPYPSHLVRTVYAVRRKPLGTLSDEELRLALGQQFFLEWVLPLALERLSDDPFRSGDFYLCDFLVHVTTLPPDFWALHEAERETVIRIIAKAKGDIRWLDVDHQTQDVILSFEGKPMDSQLNPEGKTILITGSTDGVGRMVAERLAADGAHVLVHGRDRVRGESLVKAIAQNGKGKATLYIADLASLADVRRLAKEILADNKRIDVLINNAGIGFLPAERALSTDGYELRFAVNYLAGFLLTQLLLPTLKASTPSRIVNVASLGQSPVDFDDVMMEKNWQGGRVAYTQSKLAEILFAFDLAEQLAGSGVTVTALHPATFMATGMVTKAGIQPASTVEEGAEAILALAVGPQHAKTTGAYFNGLKEARANAQAYDPAARKKLRELSLKLTGLSG
jgi:NAD(P)-dependent dehydrogenase (short-subunit alcohol dehydrogenase family)